MATGENVDMVSEFPTCGVSVVHGRLAGWSSGGMRGGGSLARPRRAIAGPMTDDVERRVIELEIKLTHQDRLLEELNEVVIEQRASLDKLHKRTDALEKALFALQDDPGNEPPPHY